MALLALIPFRWLWDRIARTMDGRSPPRGRARYRLALALASLWVIGLWITYLRWRPEVDVSEAPERSL